MPKNPAERQRRKKRPPKPKPVRIVPLGGLDEIGKNMTVIEYGDDLVVVDAGLMFPDEDHPGIDLILPDYAYILQNADKLRGIVITHGHEDHIGALPYLLRDLGRAVPVLGSRLTLGFIKGKLDEAGVKNAKLREVKSGSHATLGPFSFDFFAVNHSIPDAMGVFIRTPEGNILHTGDFKFDQTPIDGILTDYAALARFAKQGVDLMLSDSTNAERGGVTRSEAEVGKVLRDLIADAKGQVLVASFASHIHRVQQVCDAAIEADRKVAVTGRSMLRNTAIARDLGLLDLHEDDLIDSYQIQGMPPEELVILCTGSQGEPLSALARIANGDHRTIRVEEGDTVVISATPVPGNEKAVSRVINRLAKLGAIVHHRGSAEVHVSGHAASEELKLMLNLAKPKNLMPVHGETRHLHAHARLAESVGVPHENIFVLDNGEVLELAAGVVRLAGKVPSGVIFVDGLKVGDSAQVVLRDRQHMSQDGFATIVIALDTQTGKGIGEVELVTRGMVLGPDEVEILNEARQRINKVLERTAKEGVTDIQVVKNAVRESLSQFLWERMRRRPMIIPVVMEV
jgi:ribonuclease J